MEMAPIESKLREAVTQVVYASKELNLKIHFYSIAKYNKCHCRLVH